MSNGSSPDPAPPSGIGRVVYGVPVWALALAYLIVGGVTLWIYFTTDDDSLGDVALTEVDGFKVFAVFYIVAQAIERIVDPLLNLDAFTEKKTEAQTKLVTAQANVHALMAADEPAAGSVKNAQAQAQEGAEELSKVRRGRALVAWALAALIALLVCSLLELRLIDAIATINVDGNECTGDLEGTCADIARIDILVSAFAIAGGTKPLHDLISRIEKSSAAADPAAKPATDA